MSSDLFQEVGEALYGVHWQTAAAKSLGVTDRQVRRWVAGTTPIPAGVYRDLSHLLSERRESLLDLVGRVDQWTKSSASNAGGGSAR